MLNYFQNCFALSKKGAHSLAERIVFSALLNIAMMFPAVFVFMFLTEYLRPVFDPHSTVTNGFWYYAAVAVAFLTVVFVIALWQYTHTFFKK